MVACISVQSINMIIKEDYQEKWKDVIPTLTSFQRITNMMMRET